ncbi:type I-G CRISPR-associated helicase/endonuclease Cas3g [Alicyclobacillus vulcanalis]|uniref:CRISPR-associated endonuclease/helicase Cas3 n=1 Tax=Alicyclobacillus vulcanalis TaxID=252246 RepID=A0A1N7LKR8_9BACL|nr:type I-U CRISPR-associated helicase/endonuclease Cas3 [Alicyclobacillus vulcanalis]SIS74389.1 CRISPR-associated endonuclease/helicase Cas3 [Alicyclobacillus vulcanalis]
MSTPLDRSEFASFLQEVHGYQPFPWQVRLFDHLVETGAWPELLKLPTSSGKTTVIDIAVFYLALEADAGANRRAPMRLAFIVDRRLVVDDAYQHAKRLAENLEAAEPDSVSARVAARLRELSGSSHPLVVRRLRGGVPREDDWARTPIQPTVLCSTVDQVGSRLLFRGYGVSDAMKPVHAGLLGADCHLFVDEAHLAEPLRQTLSWVAMYNGPRWRTDTTIKLPWGYTIMTATPQPGVNQAFELEDEDFEHPILSARWSATKPVRLIELKKKTARDKSAPEESLQEADEAEENRRVEALIDEFRTAAQYLQANGVPRPAIAIVVNRVGRARAVFDALRAELASDGWTPMLLMGPARPLDRDAWLTGQLAPIRTRPWPERRDLEHPIAIVATQCIEVGIDIDLDAVITDAAPIDALRQRFGRLNRAGRPTPCLGAIVATPTDLSSRTDDPVYGGAIAEAWAYLKRHAQAGRRGEAPTVDFGLAAFESFVKADPVPDEALSPTEDAPVLMPAHVDLLACTSPVPAADPEVSLYLHGPKRQPDAVSVIWRADIHRVLGHRAVFALLQLVLPRSTEAVELPVWAVKMWLRRGSSADADLADVASQMEDEDLDADRASSREVFRWTGNEDTSAWISANDIRPGDTIVLPASYGGLDAYGWNPEETAPVRDLGLQANLPFQGSYFTVRVAPGLVAQEDEARLAAILAEAEAGDWRDVRDGLLELKLDDDLRASLMRLDAARGRVQAFFDIYGRDAQGRPIGVVLEARRGVAADGVDALSAVPATEDDLFGSITGVPVELEAHCQGVAEAALRFARAVGLPESIQRDLELAGLFHDFGKADRRFQSYLAFGDPLGPDMDAPLLAKSGRPLPYHVRADVGLPDRWRHEALSVSLAPRHPRFQEAGDPELVLWLVGTHHGYGRPFFPHDDPASSSGEPYSRTLFGYAVEMAPSDGPQSLAYDWHGVDWAGLYELLKARYGVWGLAYLEAVLRLADHRVSEEEQRMRGVTRDSSRIST